MKNKVNNLIVGLGNQGNKRKNLLAKGTFKTVDPYNKSSDYKDISEVNLENFERVYICTPDSEKFNLIKFLIKEDINLLVEKPLQLNSTQYSYIKKYLMKNKSKLYVAYNHRFEPNINYTKKFMTNNSIGKIYAIELLYSNGTARIVRNSKWRDKNSGVIPDLLSHLINILQFWFPKNKIKLDNYKYWKNENLSPDRAVIDLEIDLNKFIIPTRTEVNLISWKNEFRAKIYAEKGNIILKDFCKWGNSTFEYHSRILPSGIPKIIYREWDHEDPTWIYENKYFENISKKNSIVNFNENYVISKILSEIKIK